MAKVTAPLLSLKAQGNFGGALNFGYLKGSSYARKAKAKIAPKDPRSDIQIHNRYFFKNLVIVWQNLEEQERDFLDIYAEPDHMSGFNFFIKGYLRQHPTEAGMTVLGVSELGELIFD